MATEAAPKYRRSRIRAGILEYLQSTDSHPSAEQVHDVMRKSHPNVSFGTVYRNLNILVDQGEVARLESSRDKDRFDANMPTHAHFLCRICGNLYDLPPLEADPAKELQNRTGHKIEVQNLEFTGICVQCDAQEGLN